MSDSDDIEELQERIRDLSSDDRRDLLASVRRDRLGQYLDIRGEYMADLAERGLVGQYPPDSPLAEHCREHPDDPLCWVVRPAEGLRESLREFVDVRDAYVEQLEERDLLDVEREMAWAGRGGAVAQPGPEGWPPKPPGWPDEVPWPPWGPVADVPRWRGRPRYDPGTMARYGFPELARYGRAGWY